MVVAEPRSKIRRIDRERRPNLELAGWKLKLRPHHSDDRVRSRVETDRFTDNARIARESPLPQSVAQEDNPILPGLGLIVRETPAQSGPHPKYRQEVCRDARPLKPLGIAVSRQIVIRRRKLPQDRNVLENSVLGQQIPVICRGHWASRIAKERRSRPDGHESLRIRKRQRPQDDCVNDTENRRVRPDAEREREHGHSSEAGVLQQLAKGEFEIIHNAAPPSDRLWPLYAPVASTQTRQ